MNVDSYETQEDGLFGNEADSLPFYFKPLNKASPTHEEQEQAETEEPHEMDPAGNSNFAFSNGRKCSWGNPALQTESSNITGENAGTGDTFLPSDEFGSGRRRRRVTQGGQCRAFFDCFRTLQQILDFLAVLKTVRTKQNTPESPKTAEGGHRTVYSLPLYFSF